MTNNIDTDKIREKAAEMAQHWVDNFNPDGKPDMEGIQKLLSQRNFEDEMVITISVKSYQEVSDALRRGVRLLESDMRGASDKEIVAYVKKLMPEYDEVPADLMKHLKSFDGKSLKDASDADVDARIKELEPWRCIWDYYDMAFWESVYSQLPSDKKVDEFMNQSFFDAFKLGLGFCINLGSLVVGVALPEAHRDEEGRLHAEDKAAVVWGDDHQYWWRGVQIERDWIENKDDVDPKLAMTWENMEQRRCLTEIIGWEKVLTCVNQKEIQRDARGILIETDSLNDGEEHPRFVKVQDASTDREYILRVPPETQTASEGVAWTFDIDAKRYNPLQET